MTNDKGIVIQRGIVYDDIFCFKNSYCLRWQTINVLFHKQVLFMMTNNTVHVLFIKQKAQGRPIIPTEFVFALPVCMR